MPLILRTLTTKNNFRSYESKYQILPPPEISSSQAFTATPYWGKLKLYATEWEENENYLCKCTVMELNADFWKTILKK